jgi:hypothetical protein
VASVLLVLVVLPLAGRSAGPTPHWLASAIAADRHHPILYASDLKFVRSDPSPFLAQKRHTKKAAPCQKSQNKGYFVNFGSVLDKSMPLLSDGIIPCATFDPYRRKDGPGKWRTLPASITQESP